MVVDAHHGASRTIERVSFSRIDATRRAAMSVGRVASGDEIAAELGAELLVRLAVHGSPRVHRLCDDLRGEQLELRFGNMELPTRNDGSPISRRDRAT
jgi:hypothetical protein